MGAVVAASSGHERHTAKAAVLRNAKHVKASKSGRNPEIRAEIRGHHTTKSGDEIRGHHTSYPNQYGVPGLPIAITDCTPLDVTASILDPLLKNSLDLVPEPNVDLVMTSTGQPILAGRSLRGLADATWELGTYALTVNASTTGLTDTSDPVQPLSGDVVASWEMDAVVGTSGSDCVFVDTVDVGNTRCLRVNVNGNVQYLVPGSLAKLVVYGEGGSDALNITSPEDTVPRGGISFADAGADDSILLANMSAPNLWYMDNTNPGCEFVTDTTPGDVVMLIPDSHQEMWVDGERPVTRINYGSVGEIKVALDTALQSFKQYSFVDNYERTATITMTNVQTNQGCSACLTIQPGGTVGIVDSSTGVHPTVVFDNLSVHSGEHFNLADSWFAWNYGPGVPSELAYVEAQARLFNQGPAFAGAWFSDYSSEHAIGIGYAEAQTDTTTFCTTWGAPASSTPYVGWYQIPGANDQEHTVVGRVTLKGDANMDGKVDFQDYILLETHFGTGSSWTEGDFNGDGIVNMQDYIQLETNFGLQF